MYRGSISVPFVYALGRHPIVKHQIKTNIVTKPAFVEGTCFPFVILNSKRDQQPSKNSARRRRFLTESALASPLSFRDPEFGAKVLKRQLPYRSQESSTWTNS